MNKARYDGRMQHLNITVTGKVQGVFFRDTARRVATELGLTGFARNEPDGSVYIEAEGSENALRKFVEWCQTGPELANVDNVTTAEGEIADYHGFETR